MCYVMAAVLLMLDVMLPTREVTVYCWKVSRDRHEGIAFGIPATVVGNSIQV